MYTIATNSGFIVRSQEYNGTKLSALIDTTQYRVWAFADGIKTVKPSASINIKLVGIDLYQLDVEGLL